MNKQAEASMLVVIAAILNEKLTADEKVAIIKGETDKLKADSDKAKADEPQVGLRDDVDEDILVQITIRRKSFTTVTTEMILPSNIDEALFDILERHVADTRKKFFD